MMRVVMVCILFIFDFCFYFWWWLSRELSHSLVCYWLSIFSKLCVVFVL